MGVRCIVGRAASGKTFHCFNRITEMLRADPLGKPIYLIVPKQETFSAERHLTVASGLPGFCRARIVSFELLGEEILAECGGTAIPRITERGRQMIIGHLLRQRQDSLIHYRSSARQVGLASELSHTFAELERCGQSAEELDRLLLELRSDRSPDEPSPFIDKLADLRLLYQEYVAFLGQERFDPHRRLEQVLASLAQCKNIAGATVFVDGFLQFTEAERRMLVGLARVASELEITILMDPRSSILSNPHQLPDALNLFHQTEDAYRRLWFAFNEARIALRPPLLMHKMVGLEDESLRRIESDLVASNSPAGAKDGGRVRLIETADRRAEVDAAAREIRRLVDSGLRYRDIVVLMRNLDDYHELLDASFHEHGIPFFADRRRPAAHHPLLAFLRSAVQVALHHWRRDAVFAMLKSGLAGLSRDEVDGLENYVLLHRIQSVNWTADEPWTFARHSGRDEEHDTLTAQSLDAQRMDELRRRLIERTAPLTKVISTGKPVAVRTIVVGIVGVFQQFGVATTLKQWIDDATRTNHLIAAAEHDQIWLAMVELLDEMVDLLGDEIMDAGDFVDVLESGLERFDLALTPPTMDQVLIGTVDRTRFPRASATIVLGLNEGQFPRISRETSVLSDGERQTLREHRVDLDADSKRALLDEELMGYIALTRSSSHLTLLRALADEEARPQVPSVFWTRVRELFPELEPIEVPRDARSHLEFIGTPRQLIVSLMEWVRTGTPAGVAPLYEWIAGADRMPAGIAGMRFRAWRALSYANEAKLSQPLAASPMRTSVSEIETYAACPFKHFASYGLKLAEREEKDVTSIDLGNACHHILEKLINQLLAEKKDWNALDPIAAAKRVAELASEVAHDLRGELLLSTDRNRYLLKRIESTLEQVVAAQAAVGKRGGFVPWRAELEFGAGREVPELRITTPGGNELRLHGKIDRVDIVRDQALFAVVDYKYRGDRLALDSVYHGLSLQLLTYLIVIERNGVALAGKPLSPAAALYVRLLRQLETVSDPQEAAKADQAALDLKHKPRGLINWTHRKHFDRDLASGKSAAFQLEVRKDGAIGNAATSDAFEEEHFRALLRLAEKKLAELADEIMSGRIDVAPYRIGQTSPCVYCPYRPVCRFDVTVNRYRTLDKLKRDDVLARAMEEAE